jgi:xylulokinase
VGAWADADAACATAIQVAEQIVPDTAQVQSYTSGYTVFRRLYPALRTIREGS